MLKFHYTHTCRNMLAKIDSAYRTYLLLFINLPLFDTEGLCSLQSQDIYSDSLHAKYNVHLRTLVVLTSCYNVVLLKGNNKYLRLLAVKFHCMLKATTTTNKKHSK